MTPEEKEMLERIASQVAENNEILRSVRRSQRWNTALKVGYWLLILVLSVIAYYGFTAYLDSFKLPETSTKIGDLLKGL